MSSSDWKPVESEYGCRKCNTVGELEYYEWESSCGGYEDYHYRCKKCGHDWWIDGSDS